MRLEFNGPVTEGDPYRCFDESDGAIRIGGVDIVDEIAEAKWGTDVRVILDGEVLANGKAVTTLGWGYSEWTPMEEDSFSVGECDVLDRLKDKTTAHLVITDEPI